MLSTKENRSFIIPEIPSSSCFPWTLSLFATVVPLSRSASRSKDVAEPDPRGFVSRDPGQVTSKVSKVHDEATLKY